MKKALIFSTAYFPFVGGAEVAVKELTERMGKFEFDMITAKMDGALASYERVGRTRVYRVGFGWGSLDKFLLPIFGFLKARELNKKNQYAIAWSIMASQASVAAAIFRMANPAVKLLLTLQEGDEEEHLKRYVLGINFLYRLLIQPWHLLVLKKADFITVISNYLKERAEKSGVKRPIEIIPNGVDINNFKFDIPDLQLSELKKRLNIIAGEKVIITVSRLVFKNAVSDIILALSSLPPIIKLIIAGEGQEKENLEKLVKKTGLRERVLFVGHINHRKLPQYLKVSDIFIRPSLSEGLGNVFLEAMAAGVPVIGTKVGGIPDFLHDPSAGLGQATGLFCEARNPESIAQKVTLIIKDEPLRQNIIKNARELVVRNYDWDMIVKKMENIFSQLLVRK